MPESDSAMTTLSTSKQPASRSTEITVISAERRCADIISADVEHYRVPFKDECRATSAGSEAFRYRSMRQLGETSLISFCSTSLPRSVSLKYVLTISRSISSVLFSMCGGLHCEVQSKARFCCCQSVGLLMRTLTFFIAGNLRSIYERIQLFIQQHPAIFPSNKFTAC